MHVVFDIDGTLTRSRDADATAFASAFARTFGQPLPTTDWAAYTHATSAGILEEALLRLRRRGPTAVESRRLQKEFRTELARLLPAEDLAVPGADRVFPFLLERGHRPAIATGAWGWEGTLKLEQAGLRTHGVPFASSDDHPDRVVILRLALERAGWLPGRPAVYVGDGAWDLRAARVLGIGFAGVDVDGDGRLAALGCEHTLRDLREPERLLGGLVDTSGTSAECGTSPAAR